MSRAKVRLRFKVLNRAAKALAATTAKLDVDDNPPPVAKYELLVKITGNTHAELQEELGFTARGGFLLATDHHQRDEVKSYGGKTTITLVHANPEMTAEQYDQELTDWVSELKS